jgi:TolB-like protein
MNTAVNKLREALGDSAESPRFIETLPKRGYRFIAPVQGVARTEAAPAVVSTTRQGPAMVGVVAALVVVLGLAAYLGWTRWGHRAKPPEGRIMLAVLPFHNVSGDAEQEYFTDGLTEEMISQLGRLHPERLRVIASTSAMHYKKSNKRVDEIGRELGVDYVLEGSVRRGGERVRITAQLVQVSDQTEVWSESYESSESDVLALQSEVARAIAQQIQLKLTPQEQAGWLRAGPSTRRRTRRTCWGGTSGASGATRDCGSRFNPSSRLLRSTPTTLRRTQVWPTPIFHPLFGDSCRRRSRFPRPRRLPPKRWSSILSSGGARVDGTGEAVGKRPGGSRARIVLALELNPGYAQGRMRYSDVLSQTGRPEAAIEQMRRALESDPLSLMVNNSAGWHLYLARQYDEAIAQFKKTLELDPSFALAHYDLGVCTSKRDV